MTANPFDLKAWLGSAHSEVLRRWSAGVLARYGHGGSDGSEVLISFLDTLLALLPHCLGSGNEEVEEVWLQAAHLYGTFALRRGLAAGEVVEELELLRGVTLKLLLGTRDVDWANRGFQRELLAMNRTLDSGVAQASVAYVDDLFFAHLQGSGVPEQITPELEEEIGRQLEVFRRELPS